jgi:surfeit locus 1 family protein
LGRTAPSFVDADPSGGPSAWPRGGLTRLKFCNTHVSYALIWFVMAAFLFGAPGYLVLAGLRRK